ncbi:MAG: aldo/keto reductase [Planctomycetes bacterium]|nr:aldo/keto reductase [Planctomycetota bacterium]
MQRRAFPALGRSIGEVGLGCWQLGRGDWPAMEDAEARAVIAAALERGVDCFDTADVYGRGESEERLGRFLRELGAEVVIATKVGRFPEPGWPANFEPRAIRAHVEASLRRLRRERVELVQLHCLPLSVLAEGEVFATLIALREEGKIQAFGASVESMAEARMCLSIQGLASLQIIFNVLRQTPREALLELAARRGVAILARLPLASGLLTGRFDRATRFGASDHRSFNREGGAFHVGETFAGYEFERGLALVDALRSLLPAGLSLAQLALRWILDHPAVTCVIPGASRAEQVRENTEPSELAPLSPELHVRLRELWSREGQPFVRGQD